MDNLVEIVLRPDGVHPLDPNLYSLKETWRNVTVEILESNDTGDISIGWYKQENSEQIE